MYQKFYCEDRHQGRTLSWHASAASLDLEGKFADGKAYTISASMFQGVVLLAFNTAGPAGHTFAGLAETTRISEGELKRALTCLIFGKFRLLKKNPPSKSFAATDRFVVNDGFASKFTRVKIQQIAVKGAEAGAERSATRARVESDRRYQIEACLVRVMKARRTISHADLTAEVFKQLAPRFSPTPQMLKKRIEHLIERAYMRRQEDDRSIYHYVA